jgi:hypothetical protein
MESYIRIIQSTLRANRIDVTNPNKRSYIIIPYIDNGDFMDKNNSFYKCRQIIAKIRNEDDTITDKIHCSHITHRIVDNGSKKQIKFDDIDVDNPDELNRVKMRLIFSEALGSTLSVDRAEYEFVKQLNKEKIIDSKKRYMSNEIKISHEYYIDKPDEYFKSKGVWVCWYDFLNINTNKFIRTKDEWKIFCNKNNINSVNYNEKCHIYEQLPPEPAELYDTFTTIIDELTQRKNRRHK